MDRADLDQHLSQMSTKWTVLARAHGGPDDEAIRARGELLERYAAPIYRYLVALTRDRDAADELHQEFALKLLRGDFRHADPQRGRFRDYIKTALYHLVHQVRRPDRTQSLDAGVPEPAAVIEPASIAEDEVFLRIWREELMHRAWTALKEHESRTGQPLYTVLRARTDHPELSSRQLAEQLSRPGQPYSAEWVRKWLLRARQRFTEHLVQEVARSLANPELEALEAELQELELLDYCRPVLRGYPAP